MIRNLVFLFLASVTVAEVRAIAVSPTPESRTIILRIALPKQNQVVSYQPWVQFRLEGFALGSASQFERRNEIAVSNMGQTVHVIVDNEPYFAVNEPTIDPFDASTTFYDTSYKFRMPDSLGEGRHTLRMFPARSYGESLKGDNTFVALPFYVGYPTDDSDIDLNAPYLTYNEPSPSTGYAANRPILLDFYLSNVALSPDGYKVCLSIDGTTTRNLTSWTPYYLYGLSPGYHTIRLELLDGKNQLVPGPFNDVQHQILVY